VDNFLKDFYPFFLIKYLNAAETANAAVNENYTHLNIAETAKKWVHQHSTHLNAAKMPRNECTYTKDD